jgi:glycerol dehydrogenase-like iron-containing ADH family enzyme
MEIFVSIISALSAAVSAWYAKEAAKHSAEAAKESLKVAQQNLHHAANTAIMERLSQINQLKIVRPELWPLLEQTIKPGVVFSICGLDFCKQSS